MMIYFISSKMEMVGYSTYVHIAVHVQYFSLSLSRSATGYADSADHWYNGQPMEGGWVELEVRLN